MIIKPLQNTNNSVVIVENFYTENELNLIWRELDFLADKKKLLPPNQTESAVKDGELLKSNFGIFLDSVYLARNISDILQINRKIFSEEIANALIKINPIFRTIKTSDSDMTLISYYENGGNYFEHFDLATLTILTYFYREPKKFDGGELLIKDYDLKITPENNMTVIFPGCFYHEVTEVVMSEYEFGKYGRYCMSQFINFKSL